MVYLFPTVSAICGFSGQCAVCFIIPFFGFQLNLVVRMIIMIVISTWIVRSFLHACLLRVFQRVLGMVAAYLTRFSELQHDMINCGPVLSWLEVVQLFKLDG